MELRLTNVGVMSAEEARKELILKHDGDPTLMGGLVKGSVVCTDVDEINSTWSYLDNLQGQGVLSIKKVDNRFRDAPFPGGNRTLVVDVMFRGVSCELQVVPEICCTTCLLFVFSIVWQPVCMFLS